MARSMPLRMFETTDFVSPGLRPISSLLRKINLAPLAN
jgi:hypothetical protein